jgi:predicted alpha/beta superfamily hydrolase
MGLRRSGPQRRRSACDERNARAMTPSSYPRFGLFNTEERIIRSEHVGQNYQIGIWFPFSYASSDQRYPVLYVLDGEFAFGLATGLMPTLIGAQEVPELIVVGIAYHGITGWREHSVLRDQDFCPPGFQPPPAESRMARFTDFFKQELFPLIESEYRGSPEDRTLFGFSGGGFFALHSMLTQPGMFRRYMAASCTWPGADQYLLNCEQQYTMQPRHPLTDLYLSVGELEEDQLSGFHALTETLRKRHDPDLRLFTQILEGEHHSSGVLAKTFLYGVRTVFKAQSGCAESGH